MGRQWLHAKRAVAGLKKSQTTGKLVREISIAARQGGPDATTNAALAAALERARKESVSKDAIQRAINKGAGVGDEKLVLEAISFEGYAPHKVPVIVDVLTDNNNRTAPEIRVLFKKGQLGMAGSNKFLFDHVGFVEAFFPGAGADAEAAAIEAGANDVQPLDHTQNDEVPEAATGARFICERSALHSTAKWLSENGWTVLSCEMGHLPKNFPELTPEQAAEVGDFLQALEDHDDVHRVWAAVK